MRIAKRRWTCVTSLVLFSGTIAAACGGSPSATTRSTGSGQISVGSFGSDFSSMSALRSFAQKGTGKIATILPDTSASTRYGQQDAPAITRALRAAGVPTSGYIAVQGAEDLDATELTDAESDIADGATVLLVDPIDSGVGTSIEKYAKSHHVGVVDYDQLTVGGEREYYVGFNSLGAGKLVGQGLVSCAAEWHVSKPHVIVMRGPVTDDTDDLEYEGYFDYVLQPYFSSGRFTDVVNTAGSADPPTSLAEFEAAYSAHPGVNAAIAADDATAASIIDYLRFRGLKAKTFPITGQDATLAGLQNVLSGYECGTVYQPVYMEAQAAVALAIYLRDGTTPPTTLVNGETTDAQTDTPVASVLLTPEWVTSSKIDDTVVKDGFVSAGQLCAGSYTSDCAAAGISVTG